MRAKTKPVMNISEQIQKDIDCKNKPLGSLGQLEDIARQVGTILGTTKPVLQKPTMLVFAADHGLVEEGVSSCPKDITWQQAINFKQGGAGISVFCKQHNFNLQVIDAGVDYDFSPEHKIVNAKIAYGTKNMRQEPAMTVEQCKLAIEKATEFVKAASTDGCNVIGCGEMGIGNTSPSALLMHKFTRIPIEECTGIGAGHTNEGLQLKKQILKEISEKYNPTTPLETLATFGGFEIAMMVGAFLEARKQNMVILVDGFIATAAIITALEFDPSVKDNCLFCHSSEEKGHKQMLEYLNVEPILNLRMRLGEGTGAAIAYPIVQSALIMLNEMTTFNEIGVHGFPEDAPYRE